MDIDRGVRAPFQDPKWAERVAIGSLISLVPILNFAAQGYMLDYTRAVSYGRDVPLPTWDELGRYWVRGLLAGIAGVLYALPGIILFAMGVIPIVAGAITGEGAGVFAGITSGCVVFALGILYFVFISVFWGAAYTNYAMHEEFSALFAIGRMRDKVTSSGSSYFGAWGLSLLVGIVIGTVLGVVSGFLSFIPFFGSIVSAVASVFVGLMGALVSSHYYGQYAATAYADDLQT